MKKVFVSLLLLGTGFVACREENKNTRLPEPSQEGRNVIAWKMDGKVFISAGDSRAGSPNSRYYLNQDRNLIVQGSDLNAQVVVELNCFYTELHKSLRISGQAPFQGLILYATDPAGDGTASAATGNQYQTDSLHTGTVIVNYDNGSIIAGTFEMDVVNDAGQVRHITEGRFDISRTP